MMDVSALNDRFAIKGQLIFQEGPGGLVLAEIQTHQATASISLQGAQVLSWAPMNEAPVIWLSKVANFTPGKSVRGGVPVCWPWFGPHATEPRYPGHGYARTVAWDVISAESLADGRIQLTFRLQENDQTRAQWMHNTPLQCRITVGNTLEIELQTTNNDEAAVTITEALHTYFNVGDVSKLKILGLEDTEYLDKVDGGQRKLQHGPVTIGSEVDRVYLETRAACIIDDPVLQRKIHIHKQGSNSTIVWNPWLEKANKMGDLGEDGYRHMVCVESGNAAENTITIVPGESHHMAVTYRIERIA
jgi:glucose-6-phosphate 1-epimerase